MSGQRWYIIYIVFYFISQCYTSLAIIVTVILLHVISSCVTIIIPSLKFVCLFVSVHYVVLCLFSNCFRMSSILPAFLTVNVGIVWFLLALYLCAYCFL